MSENIQKPTAMHLHGQCFTNDKFTMCTVRYFQTRQRTWNHFGNGDACPEGWAWEKQKNSWCWKAQRSSNQRVSQRLLRPRNLWRSLSVSGLFPRSTSLASLRPLTEYCSTILLDSDLLVTVGLPLIKWSYLNTRDKTEATSCHREITKGWRKDAGRGFVTCLLSLNQSFLAWKKMQQFTQWVVSAFISTTETWLKLRNTHPTN